MTEMGCPVVTATTLAPFPALRVFLVQGEVDNPVWGWANIQEGREGPRSNREGKLGGKVWFWMASVVCPEKASSKGLALALNLNQARDCQAGGRWEASPASLSASHSQRPWLLGLSLSSPSEEQEQGLGECVSVCAAGALGEGGVQAPLICQPSWEQVIHLASR